SLCTCICSESGCSACCAGQQERCSGPMDRRETAYSPKEVASVALLGRDKEREILRAAYRRVADTGELSAVTILGAAGSGKSALLSDLLADLPSGSGDAPRVLSARAHREGLSYGVFSRLL